MKARTTALLATLALAFYLVTLGWRGLLLVGEGGAVQVALGLALLVLPLLAAWAVWREIAFGRATQAMARELEASGGLPEDDLPRTPGGRVDRAAADAWFERWRAEVEAAPQDWDAWFRLACGYDVAGDRRRARAAMRQAVALHRDRAA